MYTDTCIFPFTEYFSCKPTILVNKILKMFPEVASQDDRDNSHKMSFTFTLCEYIIIGENPTYQIRNIPFAQLH